MAIFTHKDFDEEVHAVFRWIRVDREGKESEFFTETAEAEVVHSDEEDRASIPPDVLQLQHRKASREDIANVRAMGFGVDDDSDPAPENIPAPNLTPKVSKEGWYDGQKWGWGGFCNRRREGGVREHARMLNMSTVVLEGMGMVEMFLLFFPRRWFEEVVVRELKEQGVEVSFGVMLKWLGLWLLIATTTKTDRRRYWSSIPVSRETGAPFRLCDLMSNKMFERIIQGMVYTSVEPPSFKDRFWEVRQMVSAWNQNMKEIFSPSWVSCLDESMSRMDVCAQKATSIRE